MSVDPQGQRELLGRAALGDRDAFRRLYDATSPQVFALGLRMLGDAARAEDLLQDTYLKAWYRAGEYRPGLGEPLAWLVAMARNRAIDMGRAAHRRDLPLDAMSEADSATEAEAPDGDGDARLHTCLRQLDAQQRQSVFCAYFHGLSHGEIARRFSEPIGTIKTRIRRGLASLKRCLEG